MSSARSCCPTICASTPTSRSWYRSINSSNAAASSAHTRSISRTSGSVCRYRSAVESLIAKRLLRGRKLVGQAPCSRAAAVGLAARPPGKADLSSLDPPGKDRTPFRAAGFDLDPWKVPNSAAKVWDQGGVRSYLPDPIDRFKSTVFPPVASISWLPCESADRLKIKKSPGSHQVVLATSHRVKL